MAIIREIHTTFFSSKAKDIIAAAFNYIGNGNTYASSKIRTCNARADIVNAPNGEVVVQYDNCKISTWRLNNYIRNNDISARTWIAWQIKDAIYHKMSRTGDDAHIGWKHDNTAAIDLDGNEVHVNEAYCMYEMLMSRKHVDRHYSAELIDSLRGVENDPFKTEMEVQRRNEIKLITDEYAKKIEAANINSYYTAIRKKMDAEISAIRKRYDAESKKLMTELTTERDNKLKELNDQFAALNAI